MGSRPNKCKCNLPIEKIDPIRVQLAIIFDKETKKDHGQHKPSIIGYFMNI